MNPNLAVQKILLQVQKIEVIEDKVSLLKEAIRIADSANNIVNGFNLRLRLVNTESGSSHCNDSFPAFTWVLDAYDNNPGLFNEEDFIWEYRWMIQAAKNNPDISLEQIDHLIEDWKIRLVRNDYGLREYYNIQVCMALFLGDYTKAESLIKSRNEDESFDVMDHSEMHEAAELYFNTGNIEKALYAADELFNGKMNPESVFPLYTYCEALTILYKAGREEKAAEFFSKIETILSQRTDTSGSDKIGYIIEYLMLVDKDKAWDYFEKYSNWNIGSEDRLNFEFSSSVLSLFKEKETKYMSLNVNLPFFKTDGIYNTEDLYKYHYNVAKDLSERFDARNKNTFFSQKLNAHK